MKKITTALAALLICFAASAQSLGQAELNEISGSFSKDPSTKAIQNVLTGQKDIKSLVYNHDNAGQVDHFFKYRVDVKGITNQKSSGRCWMFTSMNVLRPGVMKKYNLKDFDFSHSYCFFWDLFEKANLFLENVIATADKDMTDRDVATFFKIPVADGGVWNLFWDVAEKYGVVPQSVMPETAHSDNTSQMDAVLNEYLRTCGWNLRELIASGAKAKAVRAQKVEDKRPPILLIVGYKAKYKSLFYLNVFLILHYMSSLNYLFPFLILSQYARAACSVLFAPYL